MKKSGMKWSLLAAMLAVVGCADPVDSEYKPRPGDSCTQDICQDENTLLVCVENMYVNTDCQYGCADNECKLASSTSCVKDKCIDGMTLSKCVSGVPQQETCAYGCENDACKTSSTSCLASVCQDNNKLLACVDGAQRLVDCPYGCDKGACLQACTSDICLNVSTLLVCKDGKTQSLNCQYGCEMGACLTACTADFCRDSETLVACSEGHTQIYPCPYGCNAGKCNTENQPNLECTVDTCANEMTLYKCVNSKIQAQFCQYGCADGACNTAQCTQTTCANDTTLNVCSNGTVTPVPCPYGCADNQCKKQGSTDACTKDVCADATTLNKCVGGQVVAEKCANGCANGACKTSSDTDKPGAACVYGTYTEKCIGETVYYCGDDNKVTTMDCSPYASQGYSCKAFTMSDGSAYAECIHKNQSCSSVNSTKNYCDEYAPYGDGVYEDTCLTSTTDNKNYWVTTDLSLCPTSTAAYGGSCNATGTACENTSSGGDDNEDTGDYYDCTTEICTNAGDTCGEVCLAEGHTNKAWCDEEYLYCSDPNGGNTGGDTSDYYNCSNETCSMNDGSTMTCGAACIEFYGAGNQAWCTATGEVTCSPTNPGGSGGNTTTEPTVAKNSCNLSNLSAIQPFGTCSNLNCEVHICWTDPTYNVDFTEYLTCLDLTAYGMGTIWYPTDGIYMQCNNQCATSKQACDSQGGQYGKYQSN